MLNVYTDGGARGNPGPAAIGVYITDENDKKIGSFGKKIGVATNNVAEYTAVIEALKWIVNRIESEEKTYKQINFFLDSELVVSQLNGIFKIKNLRLRELFFEVRQQLAEIKSTLRFSHIPREKNKNADKLVNMALDNMLPTSLQ